jgi:hypothetical protein
MAVATAARSPMTAAAATAMLYCCSMQTKMARPWVPNEDRVFFLFHL